MMPRNRWLYKENAVAVGTRDGVVSRQCYRWHLLSRRQRDAERERAWRKVEVKTRSKKRADNQTQGYVYNYRSMSTTSAARSARDSNGCSSGIRATCINVAAMAV